MYALFVSTYPQILRQLHQENPSLVPQQHDIANHPDKTFENLTVLQRSILAAVRAKEKGNFDVEDEKTNLRLNFMANYHDRLQAKNSSRKKLGVRPQATKFKEAPTTTQEFWVAVDTDGVSPITYGCFWNILKRRKIKFTTKIHAHPCPLHQKGPGYVARLEAVRSQLAALPEEKLTDLEAENKSALLSKLTTYEKKVREWELHKEQFEHQRQYVQNVESTLLPRQCMLFRDFVNQHNGEGGKVIDLVLTVVWRDEEGHKQVLKLHHFCTDKTKGTDAGFYKDVMDFQLSPKDEQHNGIFDNFEKIYLSGDHGPHFACNETLLWDSRVKEVYGKVVEPIFLCSYHAYNRCDGAGMETKR